MGNGWEAALLWSFLFGVIFIFVFCWALFGSWWDEFDVDDRELGLEDEK